MSHTTYEEAVTRQPCEIYHIYNDFIDYHYTDGDVNITVSGTTYDAAPISRSEITYNSELEVSEVEMYITYLEDPVVEYIAMNPVEIVWVSIMKAHRNQLPLELSVIFIGQIKSVEFQGNQAKVTIVGFEHYLKQVVPKNRYQPMCNWFLYSNECTVNINTYSNVGTITAISSDNLTLTCTNINTTNGYYTHGYMEFGHHKRVITNHIDSDITLRYKIEGLIVGNVITCYAGCDLCAETCRDKFANMINFGGHLYIPIENPCLRI